MEDIEYWEGRSKKRKRGRTKKGWMKRIKEICKKGGKKLNEIGILARNTKKEEMDFIVNNPHLTIKNKHKDQRIKRKTRII